MLELGLPRIYVGSSKYVKHILGGSWCMPPRKILKIRYQEIEFGGIFGGFSRQ